VGNSWENLDFSNIFEVRRFLCIWLFLNFILNHSDSLSFKKICNFDSKFSINGLAQIYL
jgi:hypothetical protein